MNDDKCKNCENCEKCKLKDPKEESIDSSIETDKLIENIDFSLPDSLKPQAS